MHANTFENNAYLLGKFFPRQFDNNLKKKRDFNNIKRTIDEN